MAGADHVPQVLPRALPQKGLRAPPAGAPASGTRARILPLAPSGLPGPTVGTASGRRAGVGEGCSSPPPQPRASEAGGGYGGGGQPGRGGTKRLCWEERPELGREAFVENAERQAGRGGAGGEWGLCARRPHPGLSGPARLHGGPACVPPPEPSRNSLLGRLGCVVGARGVPRDPRGGESRTVGVEPGFKATPQGT